MGTSGYTETEKIKILYEESLRDIHALTERLEKVSSKVNNSVVIIHEVDKLAKSAITEAAESFHTLADNEMKRASDSAISSLSTDVGKIAQKIAGDAAAATAADARSTAAKWQGGMLVVGMLIGVTGTYLAVTGANAMNMSAARDRVAAAEMRAETAEADAKKRADDAIAAITEKSGAAVAAVAARNAWAATAAGQVAHKLAEAGDLGKIAGCLGDGWEKKKDEASGAFWCYIPQSDGFFSSTKLVPQFRVYDYKK